MNTKKLILASAILAVSTGAVATEHKRLAFSKKLGVEVSVVADTWCKESAEITFKANDPNFFTSQGKVVKFMKTVGKVIFPKECPSATTVKVTGMTADGNKVYNGVAKKQQGWVLAEAKPEPPSAPEPKATEVAKPAPQSEPTKVAQPAPAPQGKATLAAKNTPEPKPVEVTKTATVVPEKPKAQPAPQEPQQTAQKIAEPVKQKTAAAPKPAKPEPPAMFAVNGWVPTNNPGQVLYREGVTDIKMETAEGCGVYVSGVDPGMLSNYSVHTKGKGFICQDGMLNGYGTVQVERSDGRLMSKVTGDYIWGHAFVKGTRGNLTPQLRVNRYSNARVFAYLGTDFENKAHHIVYLTKERNGLYTPFSKVYVITENEEAFKHQKSLQATVKAAHVAIKKLMGDQNLEITVLNKFPVKGIDNDDRIYKVNAYKNRNQKFATIQWDRADNYVFQREQRRIQEEKRLAEQKRREEARQAEIARRAAERKAQQERWERQRKLEQMEYDYQHLVSASDSNVLGYRLGRNYLNRLGSMELGRIAARGETDSVAVRVLIDSVDGKAAKTSWPFEIEISSTKPLKEDTWYILAGEVSASFSRIDDEGLLIPQLKTTRVLSCEKEGCKDLVDPIAAVREKHAEPDWHPANDTNG